MSISNLKGFNNIYCLRCSIRTFAQNIIQEMLQNTILYSRTNQILKWDFQSLFQKLYRKSETGYSVISVHHFSLSFSVQYVAGESAEQRLDWHEWKRCKIDTLTCMAVLHTLHTQSNFSSSLSYLYHICTFFNSVYVCHTNSILLFIQSITY